MLTFNIDRPFYFGQAHYFEENRFILLLFKIIQLVHFLLFFILLVLCKAMLVFMFSSFSRNNICMLGNINMGKFDWNNCLRYETVLKTFLRFANCFSLVNCFENENKGKGGRFSAKLGTTPNILPLIYCGILCLRPLITSCSSALLPSQLSRGSSACKQWQCTAIMTV